jgi:hypothetical protein
MYEENEHGHNPFWVADAAAKPSVVPIPNRDNAGLGPGTSLKFQKSGGEISERLADGGEAEVTRFILKDWADFLFH